MGLSNDARSVIPLRRSSGARFRLFCLPCAGGGASMYRRWASAFPPDVEVYAIQLPGREERIVEPPLTSLKDMMQTLLPELLLEIRGPYALFGHSMGALLAFELAHELRNRGFGHNLLHLFVSGRRAPHLPDQEEPPVSSLNDLAFVDRLRYYNGTPDEVLHNQELMELLLPVLRADFAMCESYIYLDREPFTCGITAFGGIQDPGVPTSVLEAWNRHTIGHFEVRMVEGDHFFLNHQPQVVTSAIIATLD